MDELVKLIDKLHLPNTPQEIKDAVLSKDAGRKQMETVARVRGAAAKDEAPAADSLRPLQRNAPGVLPLKRSCQENTDDREIPSTCSAASVPPSSTVSCELVTGGADSGEPSRPRDVRDISPGHPAVTRSLEENRNASERAATAAEERLRTDLSRGLGEAAAKKAAERTRDGSRFGVASSGSSSNELFGVTKRDHLRRQLEKSRAYSNITSASAATSSAHSAGRPSERSAPEDVVNVSETQKDEWKMNVPIFESSLLENPPFSKAHARAGDGGVCGGKTFIVHSPRKASGKRMWRCSMESSPCALSRAWLRAAQNICDETWINIVVKKGGLAMTNPKRRTSRRMTLSPSRLHVCSRTGTALSGDFNATPATTTTLTRTATIRGVLSTVGLDSITQTLLLATSFHT